MKCDYCGDAFTPSAPGQRFCVGKGCRQKWWRENQCPGEITGVRALKRGGWSVTIHFKTQPALPIGAKVKIESGA